MSLCPHNVVLSTCPFAHTILCYQHVPLPTQYCVIYMSLCPHSIVLSTCSFAHAVLCYQHVPLPTQYCVINMSLCPHNVVLSTCPFAHTILCYQHVPLPTQYYVINMSLCPYSIVLSTCPFAHTVLLSTCPSAHTVLCYQHVASPITLTCGQTFTYSGTACTYCQVTDRHVTIRYILRPTRRCVFGCISTGVSKHHSGSSCSFSMEALRSVDTRGATNTQSHRCDNLRWLIHRVLRFVWKGGSKRPETEGRRAGESAELQTDRHLQCVSGDLDGVER